MILRALLLILFLGIAARAQEPKVRASIEAKGDCWVGQRVTLVVELLAPGYFAGAPSFDLPNAPGLLIIPPTGHPVVSSETIGETSYTAQRHELSVFARRGGEQHIPAFTVRFSFKRTPLDQTAVAATVKTTPVTFSVKVPPGAEKLGGVISARGLTAVEAWKPEPGPAKAGAAFTRTMTFTAPDVPAMAFPPFPVSQVDGLGIYRKPPEVLDRDDRGTLTGQRREMITYVCQRPGEFVIPAARLTWFDLDTKQLQTIDFPARKLTVAVNPALASAAASSATVKPSWFAVSWAFVAVIGGALAACVLLVRFWKPMIAPFRPVHLAPLNPISRPR